MNNEMIEIFAVVMFFIGFYGIITSRNIIKSVVSIGLMEMAVVVFFLGVGFISGAEPPIGTGVLNAVDPLPQALVITAIIIGVTVSAVNVTMLISLGRKENSTDWDAVKNKNSG